MVSAASLLFLTACVQSADTDSYDVQPDAPAARTYTLRLDTDRTWVVDENGNTISDDAALFEPIELRDVRTNELQCKVVTRAEDTGRKDKFGSPVLRFLSALYDQQGNLIQDWQEADYNSAFGDFLIRISPPVDWYDLIEGNVPPDFQCSLWNYKTGETRFDGAYRVNALEDGSVLLESWNRKLLGVVDADAAPISEFPAPVDYYLADPWNECIIASTANTQDGSADKNEDVFDVLLTKELEPILTRRYLNGAYYGICGRYLSSTEGVGSEARDVMLNQKGETVFSGQPGENIRFFDGELAILQINDLNQEKSRRNFQLVTKDHTVLADGFSFLEASRTYEQEKSETPPARFLGIRGQTALLLDRCGKIVASAEMPGFASLSDEGEGFYIYEIEQVDGSTTSGMLDESFQEIIPAGTYSFIDRMDDWTGGERKAYPFLRCGKDLNGTTMFDICDLTGNVIIPNVSRVFDVGSDRFAVGKGFDVGLMDEKGNWIVKRSIFTELDDE